MSLSRRQLVLAAALVLTLAATAWYAVDEDPGTSTKKAGTSKSARTAARGARASGMRPSAAAEARPAPDAIVLRRDGFPAGGRNLFAAHDWQPPARRAAAAPPPPPPVAKAPPLPYKFVGRMVEERGTVVFLAAGPRTLLAREGDVLDGQYRVDAIGADSVAFTYRPLAETQRLPIERLH